MELLISGISISLALSVIATLGYLFGRQQIVLQREAEKAQEQLDKTHLLIRQMEQTTQLIRRRLASHHTQLTRFCQEIDEYSKAHQEQPHFEAGRLLTPAKKMSVEIAAAYDEMRQQTSELHRLKEGINA